MVGRAVVSLVMMTMLALLLSQVFPGKRGAPAAPSTATMTWRAPLSAAPLSFDELTDFTTCQEMQRQLAEQHDDTLTIACHEAKVSAVPL